MFKQLTKYVSAIGFFAALAFSQLAVDAQETKDTEKVARARETVKMLDDVYKTTVVLITDKYVNDESDFAAGSAAVALFDAIGKKGWHTVRLIDASGMPYDDKNVAKDEFEKSAIAKIKAGSAFVDAVEKQADGKQVLRAMTPIPVVMTKCAMCHDHYKKVPEGQAIGALSYTLPIK